jgi:hypothetical protein
LGTTILHTRGPRSQRYMLNMWQFLDLSRMSNILFRFSSSEILIVTFFQHTLPLVINSYLSHTPASIYQISIVTFFHHTPPYPSCPGY